MTVHRDYANKSCPGTYLYERQGAIAAEVNKRLGAVTESKPIVETPVNSGVVCTGAIVKIAPNATY